MRPRGRRLSFDALELRRCMTAVFLQHSLDGSPVVELGTSALGDLDGDGDADLILGAQLWRENLDGGGSFGAPQRFAPHNTPIPLGVAANDVDSDGDLDILALVKKNELVWFENRNGLGRFGPRQTLIQDGERISNFDMADLDQDGRNELVFAVTANEQDTIKIYRRSEPGSPWQASGALAVLVPVFEIVDWDSDGDLDLLTSEGVHSNLIAGGQAGPLAWSAATGPAISGRFVVGDFDGNHAPDVVMSEFALLRPGDVAPTEISFPQDPFPKKSFELRSMGDVDGDGDDDVVATLRGMDYSYDVLLINNGSGLNKEILLPEATFALADVTGDGVAEGVSATAIWQYTPADNSIRLLNGRDPLAPQGQSLADMDGDGDQDLVHLHIVTCVPELLSCDVQYRWSENLDGRGTFSISRLIKSFSESTIEQIPPIHWIDVDNDGDLDGLTRSSQLATTLSWVKNVDGHGTFDQTLLALDTPIDYLHAKALDLDADGDTDLVLNDSWAENLAAQGGQGFAPHKALVKPGLAQQVELHDWDIDGDLDLVVRPRPENGITKPLQFLERTRINPPTFALPVNIPSPAPPRSISAAHFLLSDFDGDGDSDVIHEDTGGRYLQWNSGGQLGSWNSILSGKENVGSLIAVDLDHDQDKDLVGMNGSSVWYENLLGTGPFVETMLPSSPRAVADIDNDGDQDILCASSWLENRDLGDVNRDGRFDSSDLVAVFAAGLYEYDVKGIATFETGDWNGDRNFDSSDLVFAFQTGGYRFD